MNDTAMRQIKLDEWMKGEKKVLLQHGERPYLLSITRKGNLILTSAADRTQKPSDSVAVKASA